MKTLLWCSIGIVISVTMVMHYHSPKPINDIKLISSDKVAQPPDPNRPFYDAAGNEYDYKGNLIKPADPTPKQVPGFVGK